MTTEVNDELRCRAAVYRLLARLWSRELDAATLGELRDGDVAAAYLAVGGDLPAVGDEETLESLATDFCQLFLGPSGHLPPYQSVWADGQFDGSSAESLRRYLELLGERPPSDAMPDHLASQLEVMANLLDYARHHDTEPEFSALEELARSFFLDHVAWALSLCELAVQRAHTDTYRAMCRVTREFIDDERDALQAAA